MYPINMLNDINMEFIQAFNPLYAVPIVAVIICAFIVYAFGFKSPVPPPSFEGIEEEKKYTKKRKAKDNQKKEKLQQNGKVNGSAATKSSAPSKKKEATEKRAVVEKTNVAEKKSPAAEKKANKKARLQNEKKSAQEKKKEIISHDDFNNDDGWVQLISKKGRKNQKKNGAAATETQSVASVLSKAIDANKSDDNSQVEKSPKKKEEFPKDITSIDQKQQSSVTKKENAATKTTPTGNAEKVKIQSVIAEEPKPDVSNLEKQHPKETAANIPKVLEESNKPKKKKKKNAEVIPTEKDSISKPKSVSDSSAVQVISEIPAPQEITKPVIVEDLPPVNKVVEMDQSSEVKTSNVAFDELAGLYPETKELKKKKKVRRDH